jgi:transposase
VHGLLLCAGLLRFKHCMLVHRAAKFCCEPSPYQAQSLGQWVGACRHEYNLALERGDYEYKNYGFSLAYVPQAKELTGRRACLDWLNFAPVHALQNALRDLDEAFDRFFKGLCRHPTPRKKFINDAFILPAEDFKFRRVSAPVSQATAIARKEISARADGLLAGLPLDASAQYARERRHK